MPPKVAKPAAAVPEPEGEPETEAPPWPGPEAEQQRKSNTEDWVRKAVQVIEPVHG
jgi:hypothetical protein